MRNIEHEFGTNLLENSSQISRYSMDGHPRSKASCFHIANMHSEYLCVSWGWLSVVRLAISPGKEVTRMLAACARRTIPKIDQTNDAVGICWGLLSHYFFFRSSTTQISKVHQSPRPIFHHFPRGLPDRLRHQHGHRNR